MQRSMWNDDQPSHVHQLISNRIDQRRVQVGQDVIDARQEGISVVANIGIAECKLANLESEPIDELEYPLSRAESVGCQAYGVEQKDNKLFARLEVLKDHRAWLESPTQPGAGRRISGFDAAHAQGGSVGSAGGLQTTLETNQL